MDDELRAELISAKNELEKLRAQDEKNNRALEEAQEGSERLLNKVSNNLLELFLWLKIMQSLIDFL